MNIKEEVYKKHLLMIFIAIELIILLSVSIMLFGSLNGVRDLVCKQYKKIYIQNHNEIIKDVVNYIIDSIEKRKITAVARYKDSLKKEVNFEYGIVKILYKRLHSRVGDYQLKALVKELVKKEGSNYTIIDKNGSIVLHTFLDDKLNISNTKDALGNNIFQFIQNDVRLNKNRETFISYYTYCSSKNADTKGTGRLCHRLIYVKYFEPWGWYLASIVSFDNIDKKIKNEFIGFINRFRYGLNDRGYAFAIKIIGRGENLKMIRVANPNLPKVKIGTVIPMNLKDADGKPFAKQILDLALSKGEGFINYKFHIIKSNKIAHKITYIKYYPQWRWIVGSGYYLDVFNDKLITNNKLLNDFIGRSVENLIFALFFLEFVLFVFTVLFINRILDRLKVYRQEIQDRERFQRYLIESIPTPLIIFDKDGKIVSINRSFEEFFGVDGSDLESITKDAQIRLIKEISMGYLDKQGGKSNIDVINNLGQLRNIELHMAIYCNIKTKKPDGIVCVLFDVTQRRIYENELLEMSTKDELTGLYNRRYFNKILARELVRAKRYNEPLSMIMYDIDHFKNINDTYGHQIGDKILKSISDIVVKNIRSIDYVFRVGGEEFIILLIKTDVKNAFKIAEKIRVNIADYRFGKVGSLTISLGVAQLKEDDTIESFYKRVDKALYMAKNSGRNNTKIV